MVERKIDFKGLTEKLSLFVQKRKAKARRADEWPKGKSKNNDDNNIDIIFLDTTGKPLEDIILPK